MKRLIVLSLAILIAIPIFAGCTPAGPGTSSSSESEVTKTPGIVKILMSDPALKTDPKQWVVWQKLESDLNVDLQCELVPGAQYEQIVGTRLAAGSIDTDIFKTGTITPEQLSASGAVVKLSDYFDTLLPNVKKAVADSPYLKSSMTSPDGGIWFLPKFYGGTDMEYPLIRQDWLDKLNIKMPVTLDDLYNYFVLVKKTDLNGNGKLDEIPWLQASIEYSFLYSYNWFGIEPVSIWNFMGLDEKGGVSSFLTSPDFKAQTIFLAKCFKEGLINNDLPTMTGDAFKSYMLNDRAGFINNMGANYTNDWDGQIKTALPASTAKYVYMSPPDAGYKTTGVRGAGISSTLHYISATGKNINDALRVYDYVFSPEGSLMTYCGLKDKTYIVNADGSLAMGPYIAGMKPASAIPDYLKNMGALSIAGLPINLDANGGFFPTLFAVGGDRHIKAIQDLKSNPKVSQQAEVKFRFTPEEGKYLSENFSPMETYVWEQLAKYFYGTQSFDNWDAFVSTLESQYKLSKIVEIYNTTYARSNK